MKKGFFYCVIITFLASSCGGQSYYDIAEDGDGIYNHEDQDGIYEVENDFNSYSDEPDISIEDRLNYTDLSEPMEVNWTQLISNYIEDGQIVNFEGYIGRLPTFMSSYDKSESTIDVFERRNQTEGKKMSVSIVIGTSPGHIRSLPKNPEQKDLRIVCDQDLIAGVGTQVRIQGEYSTSSGDYYNYLDLKKIRILSDDFDGSKLEKAVELTNAIAESDKTDKTYCYMDAKLSLSSYMSSFHDKYTINISQDNNKYTERAYCYIGTTAGKMEALPNSYSDRDFIIYDYLGNQQKGTSGTYRIYGTFNKLDVESLGVFTIEEFKKL